MQDPQAISKTIIEFRYEYDITEPKHTEEAQRTSEGHYRLAFENAMDINHQHELNGISPDAGKAWAGAGYNPEAASAITNAGICRDVTEQKQLEEGLRQTEKMEALGRLAGTVAHDFNNLLALITGYSDLLLKRFPPGVDSNRKKIEEIRKASDRGVALTRQLLAFSRRQALQFQALDLNAAIAGMDEILRQLIGENIRLQTSLDPEIGPVKADPDQVEQVLLNLAENARDAMPEGGSLTIETAHVESSELFSLRHESLKPGPYVMVAVSDTGSGINQETQARIFEPFFTTKEKGKGTGLGLSTVYGIVMQSGGCIRVYSEVGVGTTFKIYLPRIVETVEPNIGGVF